MSPVKSRICLKCFKKHGAAKRSLSINPPVPRHPLAFGERARSKPNEIVGWLADGLKILAALISIFLAFWKN